MNERNRMVLESIGQTVAGVLWIAFLIFLFQGINSCAESDHAMRDHDRQFRRETAMINAVNVAAEMAYQRAMIAKDDFRYADASKHCRRATELRPYNPLYKDACAAIDKLIEREP